MSQETTWLALFSQNKILSLPLDVLSLQEIQNEPVKFGRFFHIR
jgi:hypothetical protein